MNRRAIHAIVRKDLKVTMQNKGVVLPLLLVPLIMFVALPSLVGLMPLLGNIPDSDIAELQLLISRMPPTLQAELAGYTPLQLLVVMMIVYYLAPMYLIVPMMVASVIAADSFAGEKERKTLEALLYTPTTDQELLLGKLLAAWLPAVGVALAGFVCYSIVANLVAGPIMGGIFFPTPMWLVLAFWVAPAIAGLGLVATILVSSRAQGFQDAYQMGALVVLPLLALMISQATGVMFLSTGLVFFLGAAVWILDGALLWWGGRWFRRTELFSRL